jgi:hypothetical protein
MVKYTPIVRSEDLTAVTMEYIVFWDVLPWSFAEVYTHLEATPCLHLQGRIHGVNTFIRKVGKRLPDCKLLRPGRLYSISFSSLQFYEILQFKNVTRVLTRDGYFSEINTSCISCATEKVDASVCVPDIFQNCPVRILTRISTWTRAIVIEVYRGSSQCHHAIAGIISWISPWPINWMVIYLSACYVILLFLIRVVILHIFCNSLITGMEIFRCIIVWS